jgi:FlaA1/EpsC-like NDP-sugar epimerase
MAGRRTARVGIAPSAGRVVRRQPQLSASAPRSRVIFFVVADLVLLTSALVVSTALRFDGVIPGQTLGQLPIAIALSLCSKIAIFGVQHLYSLSWSHVGLEDMVVVLRGVTLGSVLFSAAVLGLTQTPALAGFPPSVLPIDYVVTLVAIGGLRLARRIYQHVTHPYRRGGRPALIVGAGPAAEQIARSLKYQPASGYVPIGFVSDDPAKAGTVIHGLPVLGNLQTMPRLLRMHRVQAVLIAMRSGTSRFIRNVVSSALQAGVAEIRVLPGPERIVDGHVSFTDFQEVRAADLLGRDPVSIDTAGIEGWLRNRTVLVTGAAGSIGSELCRQIARFRPSRLALLDCDETQLFHGELEMRRLGQPATAMLADVRDAGAIGAAFRRVEPHVVFHAAAYKHVGLMERHPEQAVSVNVLGTHIVARAAAETGVEKFILISTDKAVNPTSVMGASKRAAEQICLAWNVRGPTRYVAVRFGNVLGSRGSVVPLFQDQIRRGEPLTIRGRQMRRYFMSVSEAVLLVLQAGAAGQGGEIFVLDMGEPVHIADLARDMIRLSGLEPDVDVPIVFSEPVPGEKEHEDLLAAEEGTAATRHERIFVAAGAMSAPPEALFARLAELRAMVDERDPRGIIEMLRALVPTYQPSEGVLAPGMPEPPSPTTAWARRSEPGKTTVEGDSRV